MGLLGIHKTGANGQHSLSVEPAPVQRPLPGRFCSTLYAVFDPTRKLAFSNAGLPFPLHASATTCRPLGDGGFPSGLLPIASTTATSCSFSPGDTVLFVTDGLYEALNPQGIEFCSDCMSTLFAQNRSKSAAESLDHLFDGLLAFSNGTAPTTTSPPPS